MLAYLICKNLVLSMFRFFFLLETLINKIMFYSENYNKHIIV